MPGVGTDRRCDHADGCPLRVAAESEHDCLDTYGVFGGKACTVQCANDRTRTPRTTQYLCSGHNTWERVGPELDCGVPAVSLVEAAVMTKLKEDGFCSYPMWAIPGVGTERRCDNREGCPLRIAPESEHNCQGVYGIMGGESCTVACANDPTRKTEYKCTGWEEFSLVGPKLDCSAAGGLAEIEVTSNGCKSQSDQDQIARKRSSLSDDVRNVVIGCIGQSQSCVTRGVAQMGFSSSCSQCVGTMGVCAKDNCKWTCTWNGFKSEACKSCTVEYCFDTLVSCSGLPRSQLPDP